ncbi:MAG: DinB family protein [Candidatus Dormibacterales bacterium]
MSAKMAPVDLLRPLEGQREETLRLVEALREEDLDRVEDDSGWTVRRLLAHLAGAELGQAFMIRIASDGQVVHLSTGERDPFHIDDASRSAGWDLTRIRAELADSRQALREVFTVLAEEDLDRAIRWPDWPARTIRSSIPYMLEHEDSHMDQVKRALGLS